MIALFFNFLGTVLGGIWADQSWGRFWGVGSQRKRCHFNSSMDCDYFTHEMGPIIDLSMAHGINRFCQYCHRLVLERHQYARHWASLVWIYRKNILLAHVIFCIAIGHYDIGNIT